MAPTARPGLEAMIGHSDLPALRSPFPGSAPPPYGIIRCELISPASRRPSACLRENPPIPGHTHG